MSNQCVCNLDDCSCEKVCNECGDKTALILQIILPSVFGIFFVIASRYFFNYMKKAYNLKFDKAIRLIVQSGFLIAWFGVISWGVYSYQNPCGSVSEWFNGDEGVTIGTVIVGMFSNIIFGFIDNAGLFFGGCYLDELFSKFPGSDDANVVAGYGNTYSDFLGAFLGTFCGLIISHATKIDGGPIWAQALGIIIGCLLGVFIPKLLLRSSSSMGLNKISARQVLLGAMEQDELEAILQGKTLLQYRSVKAFNKIDSNGDGHLTRDEVKVYMKEAMGHDYDQEKLEQELRQVWDTVNYDGNTEKYTLQEFETIYLDMAKLQLEELKSSSIDKQANHSKNSAVQPLNQELEELQNSKTKLK